MIRRIARELTALADGTLPAKRREGLLRRVSASPELAHALKQQLIAIEAIRRLDVAAPRELRERIELAARDTCATQQSPSPTATTPHAGARLIRRQRQGAPRW